MLKVKKGIRIAFPRTSIMLHDAFRLQLKTWRVLYTTQRWILDSWKRGLEEELHLCLTEPRWSHSDRDLMKKTKKTQGVFCCPNMSLLFCQQRSFAQKYTTHTWLTIVYQWGVMWFGSLWVSVINPRISGNSFTLSYWRKIMHSHYSPCLHDQSLAPSASKRPS